MWISRRTWEETTSELHRLQAIKMMYPEIRAFPKPGCHLMSLYACNEMYLQEVHMYVPAHDWYLLEKEPFFQGLIRYLEGLENQTEDNK